MRRLDLFGSAARWDFEPDRSDIDLLVEFDRDLREAFSLRTYLGLKEALEELLGRSVDLVESGADGEAVLPGRRPERAARPLGDGPGHGEPAGGGAAGVALAAARLTLPLRVECAID